MLEDFFQKVLVGFGEYEMALEKKSFACKYCGNDTEFACKNNSHEATKAALSGRRTARKQRYDFEKRLLRLEETLYSTRDKVRKEHYQWKDPKKVETRYRECCEELHLPKDPCDLDLEMKTGRLTMRFRKNYCRIGRYCDKFGENIIITDNILHSCLLLSTGKGKPTRMIEEPT